MRNFEKLSAFWPLIVVCYQMAGSKPAAKKTATKKATAPKKAAATKKAAPKVAPKKVEAPPPAAPAPAKAASPKKATPKKKVNPVLFITFSFRFSAETYQLTCWLVQSPAKKTAKKAKK